MGKTAPTYRKKMAEKINDLNPYREALRKRERESFDELMELARNKAHAATNQAFLDPMDGIYLSILLEIKLEINEIKKQLEEK